MCKPFWSVHGLHGLLGVALTPSCRGLGLTFRTDGYHTFFRLVSSQGGLCCDQCVARPNHERERKVHWVSFLGDGPSFVSLCLLVSFCVQVWTEQKGWRPWVHAAGWTSTQHYTQKNKSKDRDARAQNLKYKTTCKETHAQNTKRDVRAQKIQNTTKNENRNKHTTT